MFDIQADVAARLKTLDVLDATAWDEAGIPTGNIAKKLEATGVGFTATSNCTKERVLASLRAAGPGSVWVFHGHGNDSDGDGKTDSLVSDSKEVILDNTDLRIRPR